MKGIVIAISGPPGSGTTTIGREVAKRLRLKFFSPGLYFKKLSNVKNESKAAMQLLKTKYGSGQELHNKIDELQIEMAKKGNVVVEGTLSIHFLKDMTNYKIWLNTPLEIRAKRTSKRDKLPWKQLMNTINERETMERKMWEKLYGFDYIDQKNQADLVLDTSYMSVDQTVRKILSFIKQKQFNP